MPKHVKEAYRLLNKSIIRVDQPDIQLDEDEAADEMDVDELEADGEGGEQQVCFGFFGLTRVARWFIVVPKITVWVYFGGFRNGKCWNIL
jgi:hypothetical protein